MVPGVRFDAKNKRLLFPLSEHDNLTVALATIRVCSDPLPRSVIAAAQLSYQRDNPSRIMNIDNNAEGDDGDDGGYDIKKDADNKIEDNLNALRGKLSEKLLNSLAPFQREGVLFVMNNNGRALIADEMGLGKKRKRIKNISLPLYFLFMIDYSIISSKDNESRLFVFISYKHPDTFFHILLCLLLSTFLILSL